MENNETPAQKASALTKMFRERLQRIVTNTGASVQSPLAADWILDTLDNADPKSTDKSLSEIWKLYYMVHRLNEYHWVDKDDLPHKFNFKRQAKLLAVGYRSRKFSVEFFERLMANTAEQIKRS